MPLDDKKNIFFEKSEWIDEVAPTGHWEPGWYFRDEESHPYGPFTSREHAERALKLYIEQLLAGVSPTQIGNQGLITKQ